MRTASRPPLRRLLVLDRMIRAGQYPNARTAAKQLEVDPRTVHRDLEFLRDSWGAPLEFSHKHNGYCYRDADYALPLLRLSEGELVALFLAERLMQEYRHTPYAKDLATAFHKLTAALPDKITIDLSHLAEAYSFRSKAAGVGDAARFRQLARAVQNGRQLQLLYWTASRDSTDPRVVDPYHLVSVEGDWFLVAYCHLREDVRMFVPGRIQSLKETGERFERPADFNIGAYLDTTFRVIRGTGPPSVVKLQFAPAAARYVREKIWHPSQRLAPQCDGSLILTIEVNPSVEVKRWIMSYGSECRVLEPASLADEIKAEVRRALETYDEPLGER